MLRYIDILYAVQMILNVTPDQTIRMNRVISPLDAHISHDSNFCALHIIGEQGMPVSTRFLVCNSFWCSAAVTLDTFSSVEKQRTSY